MAFFTRPEFLLVAGMIGAHQAVPPVKIKSVIVFAVMMVHIVMGGCILPVQPFIPDEAFGKQLVPQVPHYIHKDHIKTGDGQGQGVGRY